MPAKPSVSSEAWKKPAMYFPGFSAGIVYLPEESVTVEMTRLDATSSALTKSIVSPGIGRRAMLSYAVPYTRVAGVEGGRPVVGG
jgi:hypothetical protein